MRHLRWGALALLLVLGVGLIPALETGAQSSRKASSSDIEPAIVQVLTMNCAVEPPRDGTAAEDPPVDCEDSVTAWSGTIIDETGLILTHGFAALADSDNDQEKLGWQIIGLQSEDEETPTYAFVAQPLAWDLTLGIALLAPAFTLDGETIDEDDVELPALRVAKSGTVGQGDELQLFGWLLGESSDEDRMNSTDAVVDTIAADEAVPDLGDAGWYITDGAIAPSEGGGGSVNDAGRLVGVTMRSTDDVVISRPMPETLLIMAEQGGQGEQSAEEPEPSEKPKKKKKSQPDEKAEDAATVTGSVVSADTGDAIEGAIVLVFKPGLTVDEGIENQNPDDVFAAAETNGRGKFQLYPPLQKGQEYSILILADGFEPIGGDGVVLAPEDAGDTVDIGDVELASA